MHEFSIVDGFVEISECMAEMTKYVVNEPSKSHETTLHTEDLEDSFTMLQSMKESSSHSERASFLGNTAFYAQEGNEKRSNYFSNVLKSAKQKASSFKWRQLDTRGSTDSMDEKPPIVTSSFQAAETDELPVSSQVEEEPQHEQTDLLILALISCQYQKDFKANKEAKLAEWLDGTGDLDDNCGTGDEKREKELFKNDEKIRLGD
ncbi:hypothetical protein AAZX31_20G169800 [Glycine max]